jgi:hypothetical protein
MINGSQVLPVRRRRVEGTENVVLKVQNEIKEGHEKGEQEGGGAGRGGRGRRAYVWFSQSWSLLSSLTHT